MKVLFLDIDEVMNSHKTWGLYGHTSPLADNDYRLDPASVRFIQLLHRAKVNIVLSSTWRLGANQEKMDSFLGIPILDKTCGWPFHKAHRGDEIKIWLDEHPEVERYVIVDDNSDMLEEQLPYFVQTKAEDGLQYKHMVKICELLGLEFFELMTEKEKTIKMAKDKRTKAQKEKDRAFNLSKQRTSERSGATIVYNGIMKEKPFLSTWLVRDRKIAEIQVERIVLNYKGELTPFELISDRLELFDYKSSSTSWKKEEPKVKEWLDAFFTGKPEQELPMKPIQPPKVCRTVPVLTFIP